MVNIKIVIYFYILLLYYFIILFFLIVYRYMENDNPNQKIGFWTLMAIVINAQLGASIFFLPKDLAIFGPRRY